jgi:hypothetical protein
MAEPWYAVPGIPREESNGLTAFMPHLNRMAASGAQQYKYALTGRPGTQAVPAPTGNTQISPDSGDKAQMGFARSSDAPDVWYPQQYYQAVAVEAPGAGMPIYLTGDSIPDGAGDVLPIPAVDVALALRTGQAMSPPTGVVQRVRQLPWFPRLYQAPGA